MNENRTNDVERIRREGEFHDALTRKKSTQAGYYEAGANWHALRRLFEVLGDLRGKKVLEVGCGRGWLTVDLAREETEVYAFDISEESLKIAKEYASQRGVAGRIHFKTDNAESLSYEDNTFDVVAGGGILHHLDIETTLREIHRVLRPGGKACFLEPLGHNPIINLYRRLTPDARTIDEHPLLVPELKKCASLFSEMRCEYFYFLALMAFPLMIFVKRPHLFQKSLNVLCKADTHLLRLLPFLRRYCWSAIIVLEK